MIIDVGRPAKADFALWAFCVLAVLGLHGAALFWLRDINPPKIGLPTPPPAILLELAPEPVAPPPPEPAPPPPEPPPQAAPEPPPPPPQREEPAPPPEVVLPAPKPPPPVKRPPPPRPVVRQAPPVVQPVAPPPVPAAPSQAAPPSGALAARWQSAVAAYIARFRQYPVLAQSRGDEGVALVHFVVDRAGNVSSVTLVRSSGHSDLDREATAWVARAQPVPPPPPEITQSRIELVIPLRFTLH